VSGRGQPTGLYAKVRELALSYPETTEEFPWGDRVVKVKGKVFVFMGEDDGGHFGCSLKPWRFRSPSPRTTGSARAAG